MRMTNKSLERHIKKAQLGNRESMSIIFDAYKPFRHNLASRFIGKGVDTEEVIAQIDYEFCESVMSYDSEKGSDPRLHITLRTTWSMLNFMRRELKYKKRFIPSGIVPPGCDTRADNPDATAEAELLLTVDMSDELTDFDKQVFRLYFIDGYTTRGAGKVLKCSRMTVWRSIRRIVKVFKDTM